MTIRTRRGATRQHHDANAGGLERLQRLGRRRLDRIGDRDEAGQPISEADEDDRCCLRARRFSMYSLLTCSC
jgi:hypothetical protein